MATPVLAFIFACGVSFELNQIPGGKIVPDSVPEIKTPATHPRAFFSARRYFKPDSQHLWRL